MEADAKRIIVALLLGAPFLIAALFFGTMGISFLLAYPEFSIGKPVIFLLASAVCFLVSLYATGFWGRWWILGFFMLAPTVIVVDFQVNPFFPAGAIAIGLLALGASSRQRGDA